MSSYGVRTSSLFGHSFFILGSEVQRGFLCASVAKNLICLLSLQYPYSQHHPNRACRLQERRACCGSDEVPVGEGCAAPVVCAGEKPGCCSSYFIIQSKKSATEAQRKKNEEAFREFRGRRRILIA